MEVTKHDLSYNKVKLDLSAMLDVAKHANYSDLNRISVQVTDMLRKPYEEEDTCKSTTSCCHGASNLQGLSKSLRVAAETYHTLLGLKDREEVEFVNKPKQEG